MAMNKKEAAELAKAKEDARIYRALRWTDGAKRDLPPPSHGESINSYTQGFDYNSYNGSVYEAWSSSISHGTGIKKEGIRQSASQNARSLFSNRVLALFAMRAEIEMDAAKKLAKIDAEIAAITSSEGQGA